MVKASTQNGNNIDKDEFESLLSCLIFRESYLFVWKRSSTGAVGLRQFTATVVKETLKFNYRGKSIAKRIKEEIKSSSTKIMACAGAYNMGIGGFKENAIPLKGAQNIEV